MIQTILFVAGINTLQQTFFGTRLPAVIGASYTYVPTTISIILAGRYSDVLNPQEVVSWESHLCSLMTIIFYVSNCLTCSTMVCRNSRR